MSSSFDDRLKLYDEIAEGDVELQAELARVESLPEDWRETTRLRQAAAWRLIGFGVEQDRDGNIKKIFNPPSEIQSDSNFTAFQPSLRYRAGYHQRSGLNVLPPAPPPPKPTSDPQLFETYERGVFPALPDWVTYALLVIFGLSIIGGLLLLVF